MGEIANRFKEEYTELLSRYKEHLSNAQIMSILQSVTGKQIGIKDNPERFKGLIVDEPEELRQKAEEYAYEKWIAYPEKQEIAEQAYIAGTTENGIQWHDLRKDLNDLPKFRHDILVTCEYKSKLKKKCETFEWDYKSDMPLHAIAWCEIPQFKE